MKTVYVNTRPALIVAVTALASLFLIAVHYRSEGGATFGRSELVPRDIRVRARVQQVDAPQSFPRPPGGDLKADSELQQNADFIDEPRKQPDDDVRHVDAGEAQQEAEKDAAKEVQEKDDEEEKDVKPAVEQQVAAEPPKPSPDDEENGRDCL